ncbi:prophage tail fiber N-terminal domain-containing protein [Serratia entomophila]|uniref:prophage tail fiber N-terminal domain-containing protein n=1 Tax=Serratia entomophila TaxID=42906 RepID=UPI0021BB5DD1|nr:prophage tail fiber N-terminal domain-containing protein [Serratia entomophila]
MTLISGVLKGPYGDSRAGVTITMRSRKTSTAVLNLAKSQSVTDDTGQYSLSVEPGAYEVIISVYGTQPERVGMIEVYNDSLPGTLNDFLRRPAEDDITPEIVQTVDRMRAEAATAAAAAKMSESNAAQTLKNSVKKGEFGIGGDVLSENNLGDNFRFNVQTGKQLCTLFSFEKTSIANTTNPPAWLEKDGWGFGNRWFRAPGSSIQTVDFMLSRNGRFGYRFHYNSRDYEFYTSGNTTIDANGFIKKASPIARLTGAPEKMADDYLDGFTLAGSVAVNNEAEGVSAERVSVGIYKVTGSLGFAEEGWTIEVPQDVNGNRLCFVETAIDSDGAITLKVSKRRFDVDTAAIVAGEPMDIPEGRWIDLRLAMPEREITEELPPGTAQAEPVSELKV